MITMSYACKCGYATGVLDAAQQHSNATRHHVEIHGFLTPNAVPAIIGPTPEAIKQKLREAAILRAAREKGLL